MKNLFFIIFISFFLVQCGRKNENTHRFTSGDSLKIVQKILAHRAEVDSSFQADPSSPFNRDSSVHFTGIKWYPPNLEFYFSSKLNKYEKTEAVEVFGTKGDERKYIKYGYFAFMVNGAEYRINVYKFSNSDTARYNLYKNYLSVWFTDETTGKETYHVGRYIDVGEESSNPDNLYILDFNNAYNPYCAYSGLYSCAIPRKEDHLPFKVIAGELNYHH
jgi:uncharacterized protein